MKEWVLSLLAILFTTLTRTNSYKWTSGLKRFQKENADWKQYQQGKHKQRGW